MCGLRPLRACVAAGCLHRHGRNEALVTSKQLFLEKKAVCDRCMHEGKQEAVPERYKQTSGKQEAVLDR